MAHRDGTGVSLPRGRLRPAVLRRRTGHHHRGQACGEAGRALTPEELIDQLAAASTRLRIRTTLCVQFDEPDVARGLVFAAAYLSGLASTLRMPHFVPADPAALSDDRRA